MKSFLILLSLFFTVSCNGQAVEKEYLTLIQEIMVKRNEFKSWYIESDSIQKDSILVKVRNYLKGTISKDIFPYWYGTKWDFNGTTRTPKEGNIACGYFVTNILTDLGFKIPRIKWAQSASEIFIKKLAPNDIKRFSNKPISEVSKYLLTSGDGVYLVGLDIHVGFIIVENDNISFIHSNYYQPEIGVMSESIDSRNPLRDSNYRIIGKLMTDQMIINWLFNTRYD